MRARALENYAFLLYDWVNMFHKPTQFKPSQDLEKKTTNIFANIARKKNHLVFSLKLAYLN